MGKIGGCMSEVSHMDVDLRGMLRCERDGGWRVAGGGGVGVGLGLQ